MMKKAAALAAALVLCLALTGCEQLTDMVLEEVQNALTGGDSSSVSQEESASLSAPSSEPAPKTNPRPAFRPSAPVSSLPTFTGENVYEYFFFLIGQNNGLIKTAMADEDCEAQIVAGGSPLVSYYDNSENLWIGFWLEGDYDTMMRAWENANRPAADAMPAYNCFPDDFTITRISIAGDSDYLGDMFGTYEPSPDEIGSILGVAPTEEFVPSDDEVMDSYPFDLYVYTYSLPYGTIVVRYTGGGEPVDMELF